MAHHGKSLLKARETVERTKLYALQDAVKLVETNATAKFDETVERHNLASIPSTPTRWVRHRTCGTETDEPCAWRSSPRAEG